MQNLATAQRVRGAYPALQVFLILPEFLILGIKEF
jgi:hypothetical protein